MILKFNRVGAILISALVLATVACGGAAAPEKPLLDAVREGDIETVRLHMEAGTRADDVMIPTGQEHTGAAPIHVAVLNNNLEMVKVLVEGTATLEHKMLDDMGRSPGALTIAAWYGYPEIAEYLLSMGADKNYWDGDLCTPLCAATIYPDMEDGLPPHAEDTEATDKTHSFTDKPRKSWKSEPRKKCKGYKACINGNFHTQTAKSLLTS